MGRIASTICNFVLQSQKPRTAYPKELLTISDHLRAVRLELGLCQKDVAESLVVSEQTIVNWENNRRTPMVNYMPKIISFLGHHPSVEEV